MFSYFKYKNKWNKSPDKSFVIFSEGNTYKNSTEALMNELSGKIFVNYITIDPDDIYLKNPREGMYAFYVRLDLGGLLFLKFIDSRLFVTTTPGLDRLALKRSPNVGHYSYFLHSPLDMGGYKKNSLDHFDSVVCSSDFQVRSLRYLENKHKSGKKELPVLGIPYYDVIYADYKKMPAEKSAETAILVAPSWGGNNFLNYLGYDIIEKLCSEGFRVIFRPHPQSWKIKEKTVMDLVHKHSGTPKCVIDGDVSMVNSFRESDFMISSFSGIIIDYIFLTGNPVIVYDYTRADSKYEDYYEADDFDFQSWDREFFMNACATAEPSADILGVIGGMEPAKKKEYILSQKKRIVNFGDASRHIVSYWIDILGKLTAT